MLSIDLLLHTFPFLFVFVLPDVLFKMTRFFIGSMAIKTFVWSVSIIHKIIVKIILEELAILWDWLEKTCTQTQTNKGKTNWQSYFKAAVVWRANIGKKVTKLSGCKNIKNMSMFSPLNLKLRMHLCSIMQIILHMLSILVMALLSTGPLDHIKPHIYPK